MSSPDVRRIGGPIRRVAILTVRGEPCACYLARRLEGRGVEILFLDQRRLRIEADTPAYFKRLLQRRGAANAIDNLLLYAVKSLARKAAGIVPALRGAVRGHGSAAAREDGSIPPVLQPDPALRTEGWLRYVEIDDINRPPDRDLLAEFAPDLLVLGGAPVLGRRVISTAQVACLNAHCGITPMFAGSTPFDRAIHERAFDDIGYTIHLVVPKVDGGPVLVQERIRWDPRQPNGALWPVLAQAMYDRLAEVVLRLIAGETLDTYPQSEVRVQAPAGLFVRLIAEARRAAYARRNFDRT